jgi:hypothetical protein
MLKRCDVNADRRPSGAGLRPTRLRQLVPDKQNLCYVCSSESRCRRPEPHVDGRPRRLAHRRPSAALDDDEGIGDA